MQRKISIPYLLTVDPGAEDTILLYEVEPGRRLKITSLRISFPSGTFYELEIEFLRGELKIAPYKRTYRGDNEVIEDEYIHDLFSSERLRMHYKNLNTTEVRQANILIRGILE